MNPEVILFGVSIVCAYILTLIVISRLSEKMEERE